MAWTELGHELLVARSLDEAREALEKASALDPTAAMPWTLSAYVNMVQGGDTDTSIRLFEHALSLDETNHLAHSGLAEILAEAYKLEPALRHIERVRELGEHDPATRSRQADILAQLFRHDEAIAITQDLVESDPTRRHRHLTNLGTYKREIGLLAQAELDYQQAEILNPNDSDSLSNRLTLLHYMPEKPLEEIQQVAKKWGARFQPQTPPKRPIPADRAIDRPLRVGMFSALFRQSPVGFMTSSALEHLAGLGIELYFYPTAQTSSDTITQRLKAIATQWTPVTHLDDEQFAQRIRDDKIDILLDLAGHNHGSRMRTMSMEPAPILMKWVGGLINTTGVPAIDYLLTDSIETPPGSDEHYTEKLIRMPDDYICYLPPAKLPEVGPLPAEKNGFITFGCFNNPTKINDALLAEWAKLLHAVSGSRLFLKGGGYKSPILREKILAALNAHGIEAERIRFESNSPHQELLDRYNQVDIALDPWPYSGGLTTCEAMLMGVPVITLPGPTFAGRHSATHLANAGLAELVVDSWEAYRARAADLAANLQTLGTIRQHLRAILLQSPVCDGAKFAQHLADALRAIWQRYCAGKPRAALAFTPEGQPWFEDDDAPTRVVHPDPMPAPPNHQAHGANFTFQDKIIVLDHGAAAVTTPLVQASNQLGAVEIIVFDPAGKLPDAASRLQDKTLHHYQPVALGDGHATLLYICLDQACSGTLEPLDTARQFISQKESTKVLSQLSVDTVRLDDINGLEQLDWLILDATHDNRKIIQGAQQLLSKALVVQVRVLFVNVYKDQPDLDTIEQLLAPLGFRLLRLDNAQFGSYAAQTQEAASLLPPSQLIAADAIFVADHRRRKRLDKDQSQKLAFLLHTAYQLEADHSLLQHDEQGLALASTPSSVEPDVVADFVLDTPVEPGPRHGLPSKLVVSLTSYGKRFPTLHLTLRCLLNQSVRADRTVLWIAEQEKPLLPQAVLDLQQLGLEIKYCDDIRSYKKIIPILQEEPDAFIATADDDRYYPRDWLEKLVHGSNGDPHTIVAWRAHRIELDQDACPLPYSEWELGYDSTHTPSALLFPTGGRGVLYPPHAFHADVLNIEKFQTLAPDADDVWLYWMWRLNGNKARIVGESFPVVHWPGTQDETLWHDNLHRGQNDLKLKQMIDAYGFPESSQARSRDYDFSFQGQIVALDHGAALINTPLLQKPNHLGALVGIVLDPTGMLSAEAEQLQSDQRLTSYHAYTALGDGEPAVIHACLEPLMSGTLEPLPSAEQLPCLQKPAAVLLKLPVNTVCLDNIGGLEKLDWLLLHDTYDNKKILEGGKRLVADALLIHVRVSFVDIYKAQPDLPALSKLLADHGFRLLRLDNQRSGSYFPEDEVLKDRQASQLISADAIFIPNAARLKAMSANQRAKLAFLLHTSYNAPDAAYMVLGHSSEDEAEHYLGKQNWLSPAQLAAVRRPPFGAARPAAARRRFIHIGYNNIHTQSLLETLRSPILAEDLEHQIFISKTRSIAGFDNDLTRNPNAWFFDHSTDMDALVAEALRDDVAAVMFHGLFFSWQKELVRRLGGKKKPLVWSIWGGDLYNPIKQGQPITEVVKCFHAVCTVANGDYQIFLDNYPARPQFPFSYVPEDHYTRTAIPAKKLKRIIVGNSGDLSNCHLEILDALATKADIAGYEILVPVSYNLASAEYAEQILQKAEALGLGGQVTLLDKLLPSQEYYALLAGAEFFVTAHHRQQALGTLFAALYFGVKTVLRDVIEMNGKRVDNPAWKMLSEESDGQVLSFARFKSLEELAHVPSVAPAALAATQARMLAKNDIGPRILAIKDLFQTLAGLLPPEPLELAIQPSSLSFKHVQELRQKEEALAGDQTIETLVLGQNVTGWLFDPQYCPGSFNLSTYAQDLKHSFLLYQRYASRPGLKNVVLCFHDGMQHHAMDSCPQYGLYTPLYAELFGLPAEAGKKNAQQSSPWQAMEHHWLHAQPSTPPLDGHDGYFPILAEGFFSLLKTGTVSTADAYVQAHKEYGNAQFAYLTKLLALAQAHEHRVILVLSPARSDYKQALGAANTLFASLIQAVGKFDNARILNLYEDADFTDDLFWDPLLLPPSDRSIKLVSQKINTAVKGR